MAPLICSWPCLSSPETVLSGPKSFAQAVSADGDDCLPSLPPKVIIGDTVRIRITQREYEAELSECIRNLHDHVTLQKGDSPLSSKFLKQKLEGMWPNLKPWSITPLGRGYFKFNFHSIEEMKRVWALGVVQLKPGMLRFFCWSKDFDPQNQIQSHAQLWVRFMNLPQEYWRKTTLFEIASGIGTPLTIDEATQSRDRKSVV